MKRLKIAILGSTGRLGSALVDEWQPRHERIPVSRADLDLTKETAVREFARHVAADVVLNPAGMTSLEACEDQPGLADRVNARAPSWLAEELRERRIPLIHFSTDYVFAGDQAEPYTETDDARPISVYGQTKLAGEQAVLAAAERNWVLRVSWLFDGGRRAFPDQVIEQARTRDQVEAIADKISVPTSCRDLAQWLGALLERLPETGGLYHVCSADACTWQEYAQFILDELPDARCRQVTPIRLAEVPFFRAARPLNSAMDSSRFFSLINQKAPSWRNSLAEFVRRSKIGVNL